MMFFSDEFRCTLQGGGGGIPNQVSSIQVAHVILRNSYIVECLTEQFFLASL